MSVVDQEADSPVTRGKRLLLEGYIGLRRRPWLFPLLLAAVFFAAGFVLDPATPPIDHGVFAGMFLIWGATMVVFGVLVFAVIKGLILWSRYNGETV